MTVKFRWSISWAFQFMKLIKLKQKAFFSPPSVSHIDWFRILEDFNLLLDIMECLYNFRIWIFSFILGTVSSFTYFAFSIGFWVFSPFSSGFWWISGKLLLSTDHWRRTDLSINCRLHWYHPKEGTVLTSWHVTKKQMRKLKYVQTAVFLSWSLVFWCYIFLPASKALLLEKARLFITSLACIRLSTALLGFVFLCGRWPGDCECISREESKAPAMDF